MRWNPFDNAEEYRIAAMRRRERGGGTFRVYESSNAAARVMAPVVADTWSHQVAVAKSWWHSERSEAVESFRFVAYPERYEEIRL